MPRENLHDLIAFVAVARERSFTRAAARLEISQSTLSHTIKVLEERLGLRLLTRTTRSVSPTGAGERVLRSLAPHFEGIEAELATLADLREKPAGTIRITATDYAANTIVWPKLSKVMHDYPEVRVEISIDYGLRDIVADRFDIGVRSGDQVAEGMVAVRIGPNHRLSIVGAPSYLDRHPAPTTPQQLVEHDCINLRLPTHENLLPWSLQKGRKELQVRVNGQFVLSNTYQMLEAALAGFGLAYVPDDIARPYVEQGRLRWVLEPWHPMLPGQYAYYSSHRQTSRALRVVIDVLRHRQSPQDKK